ncbi:MAG: bifunctional folylpolyglutamate synthase/dihydrofolate synthase [Negativicutes bacterium]|nr:bifunctional folylpolyglutamate synthase/dihydrofolate synthase [Negativicutes bacterium]
MTYDQALEYLASLNKFGMNFGLARIEKLLELMRHPERRFKTIHVAGTNGKGSTTAMLAAILAAAGIKAAMYTSPHLSDYTERMTVNGQPAGRSEFAAAIAYTSRFVSEMTAAGWEHPTEFEVLTAASFHYFAAAGVEYAVIEAGLGGLLDSTNVIVPVVAVITNVSLEHTDRCGDTVAAIAQHKAGIIKPGVPVITAAQGDALAVIEATAADRSAQLYVFGQDFHGVSAGLDGYRQLVAITTRQHGDLGRFCLNLLGRHQAQNAALAVMTALVLAEWEPRITLPVIDDALAAVRWPGRFEVVNEHPVVVVDGAHNPDGAEALRATLDEIFPGKEIAFLLGILADKDIAGITAALIRAEDAAIIVRPQSDRAADPEVVARTLTTARVGTAASIEDGYAKARLAAGPDGVICVAGSLYLIGAAREIFSKWTKPGDWDII